MVQLWAPTRLYLAPVIAMVMSQIQAKVAAKGVSLGQQYIFRKGLKVFGEKGKEAANKELDQLHKQTCFQSVDISSLSPEEKHKSVEALMFLTENMMAQLKAEWSTMVNRPVDG